MHNTFEAKTNKKKENMCQCQMPMTSMSSLSVIRAKNYLPTLRVACNIVMSR